MNDLQILQQLQAKYFKLLDIQIETRRDQQSTMFKVTNYPYSREIYIHKLKWNVDNTNEFTKIKNEIIELTK